MPSLIMTSKKRSNMDPMRHILVLEPSDIHWLGVQQILQDAGPYPLILWRARQLAELNEMLDRHRPDVLLLSSVERGGMLSQLLQHLSALTRSKDCPLVVACLQQDSPYLSKLLEGFGVERTLLLTERTAELIAVLSGEADTMTNRSISFSTQERRVLLELLSGHSVTHVAKSLGKDIRTVSGQKRSIQRKLQVTQAADLQLLGGQLMAMAGG